MTSLQMTAFGLRRVVNTLSAVSKRGFFLSSAKPQKPKTCAFFFLLSGTPSFDRLASRDEDLMSDQRGENLAHAYLL